MFCQNRQSFRTSECPEDPGSTGFQNAVCLVFQIVANSGCSTLLTGGRYVRASNRNRNQNRRKDTDSETTDPVHVVRKGAAEVNRQCQKVILKGSRTPRILSVRHGEERFYRGDRVLFHKPYRQLGLENGYRGTVVSLDPIRRELKVRLDCQNDSAKSGKQKLVTVPLKELGTSGITLGYASTTHKSQGATVDHSNILVAGHQTDSEMMYVQATRARLSTQFFVDRDHAGEELRDLIAAAAKSRSKVMSHDMPNGQKAQRQNEIQQDY